MNLFKNDSKINRGAACGIHSLTFARIVPLGVLIRFKNSAATLPAVLAALRKQTLQPDVIVAVDSGSSDESAALLKEAGAQIVTWSAPYHAAKVLNFGLARCPAERVLVLSSHTVLQSPDALARLNAALDDPRAACASGKWDDDSYYSDAVDWDELSRKGLKIGSVYSNSFGLLRRSFWEELPFDESLTCDQSGSGIEDYAWAVDEIRRGHICHRIRFHFSYQRQAESRNFLFTACAFRLAARHGLPLRWLGRKQTAWEWWRLSRIPARELSPTQTQEKKMHRARLLASLAWRFAC
jgi:glycosyltransferase involved in cell wall biosynthesis